MLLHGQTMSAAQLMQAAMLDGIHGLCWRLDRLLGIKEEPPSSVLHAMLGDTAPEESGAVQSFVSPEEFEAAMRAAEGGEMHGD